jgi:hypothetical protein
MTIACMTKRRGGTISSGALPEAQTCDKKLVLPEYRNLDEVCVIINSLYYIYLFYFHLYYYILISLPPPPPPPLLSLLYPSRCVEPSRVPFSSVASDLIGHKQYIQGVGRCALCGLVIVGMVVCGARMNAI